MENMEKISNLNKIILISLYFIIIITTELFYREPLYSISIDLINKLNNTLDNNFFKNFFTYITLFGSEKVIIPISIIFLFFNPLLYFIYLLFTIIFTIYFLSILKLIYASNRPYWKENFNFSFLTSFEAGYGNPSKHTLISIISYLGFWKLIQKNRFFRKDFGKIINFSLLGIFIFFILCIILSRLYFGYQSINQIIFSILLGIGLFITFYYMYKFYNKNAEMFFLFIEENKLLLNIIFSVLYILIIPLYIIRKDNEELKDFFDKNNIPNSKRLKNESYSGVSIILFLIGSLNGLSYSKNLMEKNYPNKVYNIMNWHRIKLRHKLIRLLIMIICCFPGLLFLIPSDWPLFVVLIFKYTLTFPLIGFLVFGPGFYYSFNFIHNEINPDEDTKNITVNDDGMDVNFSVDD